jgi:hypothetical protein
MININKKYWFFIEPYVYSTFSTKEILLYNTLDGQFVEVKNDFIFNMISDLYKPENGGVILLNKNQLKYKEIRDFIIELRSKYMADIIDVNLSISKPTQILSMYNLQYDVKKYISNYSSIYAGEIVNYLQELYILFDDNMSETTLRNIKSKFYNMKHVKFIFRNVMKRNNNIYLIKYFNDLLSKKVISDSYENFEFKNSLFEIIKDFYFDIYIKFPIKDNLFKKNIEKILTIDNSAKFIFIVSTESEYDNSLNLINDYQIKNASYELVFTEDNLSFFQDNVYLTKSDILDSKITMNDFFSHQIFNTTDFGIFNINYLGDIFANMNHNKLGNINESTIQEIIYKELLEGESWLRIRDQLPCSDCVYQWLCPSPSNYELMIGKPNLCHIEP